MKNYFKFLFFSSLLAFFISFYSSDVHASSENQQNIELESQSSAYSHKSWYTIQLGNIPVGVLVLGVDNTSTGLPSDYYAQFISRVGSSPFLSFIKGSLNKTQDNHLELTQKLLSKNESGVFQESENKWLEENNKFSLVMNKGATLQGLFPISLPTRETSNEISQNINSFYFKSHNNETKVLIPFTGTIALASNLKLNYDSDNFLLSADLPIQEGITLGFKRITEGQYQDFLKSLPQTLIDFGWLSAIKSPKNEINSLTDALTSCMSQTGSLNKLLIKSVPQSSYLSYRKLINITRFCTDTKEILAKNQSKSYFEKLNLLDLQIKKLLKEDRLELPIAVTNSPDLTVFYNDTVSFLWPKVTELFIHNSIEEISDNFDLERNRKSVLGIQINISSLQPRSVVRAEIKLIDPSIVFLIEKSNNSNMDPTSTSNFDKPSSYLINGQYFAKNPRLDLNSLCEKNQGKLGIDLGDAPQIIVNTGGVRGIWDVNTRVYVAREFALKTTSTKSCRKIIFRIPAKNTPALNNELEDFKNSVISPDNAILLSNTVQKRLLVMPGKYRMTTSSLVTGAVISTHEFVVEPGTNTIVTAKAN